MPQPQFDRAAQDIGNIVGIGHVNVCIDDQHLATHFYITGLGYTRDPFLNTGAGNMWVNVGMSQFHLPMGKPDVLRGVTGLVMPDREALLNRLKRVKKPLEGTKFEFRESNDGVETVCPWGNRITVHTPDVERFGRVQLGMPYVRFDVRPGTVERIARFYREVMDAPAEVKKNGAGPEARVQVGEKQYFYFRETDAPEAHYDRHHVQIYLDQFFETVSQAARTRPDHRGGQRLPIPLQGRDRSRHPRSAVHGRARDPQRHQPDVRPPADQPQSGGDQHGLQARA